MRLLPTLFAALLLGAPAAAAPAEGGPGEPVKLVRTLQLLQDQVAQGTLDSDGARRTLIETIGARLLAADPGTWEDPRNVDAALLFVLSGGTPAVLDKLRRDGQEDSRNSLVEAVRAYATGAPDEAMALWAPIDPGTLSPALIGPIALAKATLLTDADPQQAMKFVDLARLEAPGTLIEEAAVRRGIEIAAKLGNGERFEFLATRYASRFPRSMYAEAFRRRFSEFYLRIAAQPTSKPAPSLETILAPLSDEDRREVFLEIARLAIVDGRLALGKSAAENAAALSAPGTAELQRAQLYRAAALAVGDDPQSADGELDAIQTQDLPSGDRALLRAALAVVGAIRQWPEDAPMEGPPPPVTLAPGVAEQSPAVQVPEPDVAKEAQDALAAARQLLSEAGS